jgi:hypothetical protein
MAESLSGRRPRFLVIFRSVVKEGDEIVPRAIPYAHRTRIFWYIEGYSAGRVEHQRDYS